MLCQVRHYTPEICESGLCVELTDILCKENESGCGNDSIIPCICPVTEVPRSASTDV